MTGYLIYKKILFLMTVFMMYIFLHTLLSSSKLLYTTLVPNEIAITSKSYLSTFLFKNLNISSTNKNLENASTLITKSFAKVTNKNIKNNRIKNHSITFSFENVYTTSINKNLENSTTLTIQDVTDVAYKINERNKINILNWKEHTDINFSEGNGDFISSNCNYTNCFVSYRKTGSHNEDYTKFDAILFATPYIFGYRNKDLPQIRLPHQKYIFFSMETAPYYPICSNKFDKLFNWTWTFRLDSDIIWRYIVIRNTNGTFIGPKPEMNWIKFENMDPVPQTLRDKLSTKSKLVAWVVSNCYPRNKRDKYVQNLNKELAKHGFEVDIYGSCGNKKCPCPPSSCEDMIEKHYFFYLAFENSYEEYYVTEKLLRALLHDAVPIVYGGANYSRFMPDGIYLNAEELGVKKLADTMIELMGDVDKYVEFFRWKNHYRYEAPNVCPDSNNFCELCSVLNNKTRMQEITVHKKFRKWWDPPDYC